MHNSRTYASSDDLMNLFSGAFIEYSLLVGCDGRFRNLPGRVKAWFHRAVLSGSWFQFFDGEFIFNAVHDRDWRRLLAKALLGWSRRWDVHWEAFIFICWAQLSKSQRNLLPEVELAAHCCSGLLPIFHKLSRNNNVASFFMTVGVSGFTCLLSHSLSIINIRSAFVFGSLVSKSPGCGYPQNLSINLHLEQTFIKGLETGRRPAASH